MVLQAGQPSLACVEELRVGRARWRLIAIVAVSGTRDDQAIGKKVLRCFVQSFFRQRGTVSRRLRSAADVAHRWLAQTEAQSGAQPPAAAIGAVVLTPRLAVLAHVGPATLTAGDRLQRLGLLAAPATHQACELSPSAVQATGTPAAGPRPSTLGGLESPTVRCVAWPASPCTGLLLTSAPVDPASASALDTLLDGEPAERIATLRSLTPKDGVAVLVVAAAVPDSGPHKRRAALGAPRQALADVALLTGALIVLTLVSWAAISRRLDPTRWHIISPAPAIELDAPVEAAPAAQTARAGEQGLRKAEDVARGIVRLEGITPIGQFSGAPGDERHLAVADGQVYVLNVSRSHLERMVLGQPQVVLERGQTVNGVTVGGLKHLAVFSCGQPEHSCLAVLDSLNRLWSFDGLVVAPLPIGTQPPWRDVRGIAGRDRSLYVMDRGRGQIIRYRLAAAATLRIEGQGEDWLATPTDLRGAIDLAVSQVIHVAYADGRLGQFRAGAPAEFRITGLPDRLARLRAVYVSAETEQLLLVDRGYGRLILLDADGAFQAQLLAPRQPNEADPVRAAGRFAELQDAWWDLAAGQLYILAGSVVYAAPYQ